MAIGRVLIQCQNEAEKAICFGSAVLTPCQRKYCATRKELLTLVRFTRQYRPFLLGRTLRVRTDHNSLTWLTQFRDLQGQLARWMEELSQYSMVIEHRPGVKHGNADGMSRIPDPLLYCNFYRAGERVEDLPCGGCGFCQRAHKTWERFEEDVDDVLPLVVRSVCVPVETVSDPREVHEMLFEVEMDWCDINNLQKKQREDEELKVVINWLESEHEPSVEEVYHQS